MDIDKVHARAQEIHKEQMQSQQGESVMTDKHIQLIANVMKVNKPTDNISHFDDENDFIQGRIVQWESLCLEFCGRFSETYPSFNETEFRKACGEGE